MLVQARCLYVICLPLLKTDFRGNKIIELDDRLPLTSPTPNHARAQSRFPPPHPELLFALFFLFPFLSRAHISIWCNIK